MITGLRRCFAAIGFQVLGEPHVEHFVGFVEDDHLHGREVQRAPPDVIERAARRRHDYIYAALERANLTLHRRAAVDRHGDHAERLPVLVDGLGDLHRELARGHEYQRRGPLARRSIGCDEMQQRQRERGGLSGSRGGLGEHVVAFEQRRNGGALDRRRLFISERGESGEEPVVESEGREPSGVL